MTETVTTSWVPIDQLDPNPWNPNRMQDHVMEAERASIRRFGFIDPITVRVNPDDPGRWQIIDGEQRWKAAQAEELPTVLIYPLEVTDSEARRLTVILNETRGEADVVALGKLLAELREQAGDEEDVFEGMPFRTAELDHLLEIGQADWSGLPTLEGHRAALDGVAPTDGDTPGDLREVPLMFTAEQHRKFTNAIKILAQETGREGVTEIVLHAVTEAAEATRK